MARSISRILDQIERLQKEAAAIQQEAIIRIRKDIAQLGLTPEQLFGAALPRKAAKAKSVAKAAIVKFADDAGNTWAGMGKRPEWLRQALAAGKALEDFLVGKPTKPSKTAKANAPAKTAGSTGKKVTGKKPAQQRTAANQAVKPKTKKASKLVVKTATGKATPLKTAAPKKATARKPKAQPTAAEVASG